MYYSGAQSRPVVLKEGFMRTRREKGNKCVPGYAGLEGCNSDITKRLWYYTLDLVPQSLEMPL